MNQLMKTLRLLPVLLAVIISTGCLGLKAKPSPSRFYVLGTGSRTSEPGELLCKRLVLVGPVTLAGHLNNAKIALRLGENEIDYVEWCFWADPLSRALPREFIASLSNALPDNCVFSYRKASPDENSVQLELSVDQFEMTDRGNVVVAASWSLTSGSGKIRRQGRTRITRPYEVGNEEVVSGVQALTTALDDLAQKIAEELR